MLLAYPLSKLKKHGIYQSFVYRNNEPVLGVPLYVSRLIMVKLSASENNFGFSFEMKKTV